MTNDDNHDIWLGEYTDGTIWRSKDMWEILINVDDGITRRLTRLLCKHQHGGYCEMVSDGNIVRDQRPLDEIQVLELLLRSQEVP